MSSHLAVVSAAELCWPKSPTRLWTVHPDHPTKIITVDYRAIQVPLISLLIAEYCEVGLMMIDSESEYGRQIRGRIEVLHKGRRIKLTGAIVPLVGCPAQLLLPVGFLESK